MSSQADKNVAEYFEKMRKRSFESGDKSTLLWTIYACLEMRRPIPEWLRVAFLNAYEARERFEIRSWDEVFGRPVPKGTHLKPNKREAELRLIIVEHVEALAAKQKVNKELFKEVGKEWGINATRVSDIYYFNRRHTPRK
jgi:hypothetical protein